MQFPTGGLKKTIEKNIGNQTKETIRSRLSTNIDRAKNRAIKKFDSHPITKEIESGPFAQTSLLPRGYGNLYSFIGFNSNPIPSIRNVILIKPKISGGRKIKNSGTFRFVVVMPSIEDIYEASPIPGGWISGRSWVQLLERGIDNFGNYLFQRNRVFRNSRSGTGIQVRNQIRENNGINSQYISQILENYKKDISAPRGKFG